MDQQEKLKYWASQLQGSQAATLIYDKQRSSHSSPSNDSVRFAIKRLSYECILHFCHDHGVSPAALFLSAFRATHFRLTGSEDATIGYLDSDNEQKTGGCQNATSELQCVRTTIEENDSLGNLVTRVQETLRAAVCNSVPIARIAEAVASPEGGRNDLIRTVFVSHHLSDRDHVAQEGEPVDCSNNIASDLTLHIYQQEHGFEGAIVFADDLFNKETIEATTLVFYEILAQGMLDPLVAINAIPLTHCLPSISSLTQLYHPQKEYPKDSSLVDLFRQQAAACPDTIAVKDSTTQLTYAQLDRRSDQAARWLVERRLEAETLIGVYARRSCQTIMVFLGILKANLAYLPLDINAPSDRIESILSSVPGQKLVLQGEEAPRFNIGADNVEVVELLQIFEEQSRSEANKDSDASLKAVGPSASSLAYVIFTSGSTGRPKGVATEHRNVIRLVMQDSITSHVGTGTRIAHLASIAFDGSTWEIYTALLNGGTIVCLDTITTLDPAGLSHTIQQENIRLAKFTPALLHQCLIHSPEMFSYLDVLIVIGDRLDPRDARQLLTYTRGVVYNAYGPTESTGHTTCYRVKGDEAFVNGVPIGSPIDNAGVYVMDTRQRLVPNGVIGELVVVGDGLGRGYLEVQQNTGRFVNVVIGDQEVKAYRTGDYVRRRPIDGQLEFFGRMDHQVKIRGHRVELGDVEHALLATNLISEAIVLFRKESDVDEHLFCFVTLSQRKGPYESSRSHIPSERPAEAEQIRLSLQAKLPVHMIPSSITILEKMPLNQNRKIDRAALAKMPVTKDKVGRDQPATAKAPNNTVEQALCEEFAAVLGISVGTSDNFFDLGGHSLMATRVISRINQRLSTRMTVKDIFDFPVVSGLSHKVQPGLGSTPYAVIPHKEYDEPVEQSFAQRRLWFMEQLYPNTTLYHMPYALRLRGHLRTSALSTALCALESRHETLRTTFDQDMDGEVQVIQPFSTKDLTVVNVPQGNTKDMERMLQEEQDKPFDLELEPGWRCKLFQIGEEDHVLSIVMHHIISDDWSVDILRAELGTFYAAAMNGHDVLSQVPALPIQYRDFAVWEKEQDQTSRQEQQLLYWTQHLKGSQPAEFPIDKPRPTLPSGEADKIDITINGDLYDSLQQFCKIQKATPFAVLLSAFRAAHFRLTGVEDAMIGVLNANRGRQELEGLIGFFVNLQCIRTTVRGETFASLVNQTQSTMATAFQMQDVPFERIVTELQPDARDGSRNPLVQIAFTVHSQPDSGHFDLPGLQVEQMDTPKRIRFDLEFHLLHRGTGFEGSISFAKELFFPDTVKNIVAVFYESLRQGVENANLPISSI